VRSLRGEQGHIAFYTFVIIPFVVTLCIVALDVSGWSQLRDYVQREADRIVYDAALLLPNTDRARALIESQVAANDRLEFAEAVSLEPHRINLVLGSSYASVFDIFVANNTGSDGNRALTVQREAAVQVVPSDYVLILPDGETLRPAIGEDPWGNPLYWPASDFYSCAGNPAVETLEDGTTVSSDPARWATQACFNPVWTAVKYTAIRLLESFGSSPANRISVIFTPGEQSGTEYQLLRHLREENATLYPGPIKAGFFTTGAPQAQAYWRPYVETPTRLGDEVCAVLAHPHVDLTLNYQLVESGTFFNTGQTLLGECSNWLEHGGCGDSGTGYDRMDECFIRNNLSLKQAIYWRAARTALGGGSPRPNIIAALQRASVELLSYQGDSIEGEASVRGNSAYMALRKIVVLTDVLPDTTNGAVQATLRDLFQTFDSQNVEVVLVTFSHQGLADNGASLATRRAYFDSLSQNYLSQGNSTLRLFHVDDIEALGSSVVPLVSQLGRTVALMR